MLYNNNFQTNRAVIFIFSEIISACLIKHFAKSQGLNINLKIFKDLFNIPNSSILKYSKIIRIYVK
jgi:hypothetical protein